MRFIYCLLAVAIPSCSEIKKDIEVEQSKPSVQKAEEEVINITEEVVEKVVEKETGIAIDLPEIKIEQVAEKAQVPEEVKK